MKYSFTVISHRTLYTWEKACRKFSGTVLSHQLEPASSQGESKRKLRYRGHHQFPLHQMLLEMRAEGIITVFNKQLVGIFCMCHLKWEAVWIGLAVVSTTHISTVILLLFTCMY